MKALLLLLLAPVAVLSAEQPQLQFLNGGENPIEVYWQKSATEHILNSVVAPGKDALIRTTLGHQFIVRERGTSRQHLLTAEVPVQAFRFDPANPKGIPPFYTHQVETGGLHIVGSANVNPYALKEAAYLADLMLAKRPDIREALVKSGTRICIIAHNEFTCDLPEFAWFAELPHPDFPEIPARDYRDARSRGTGGSKTAPFCTTGEENLLAYPGDPYAAECIFIHEFAHAIHLRGLNNVDPSFDGRLKAAYTQAKTNGLWLAAYAGVNHHEYFAEGVQCWFDNNRENDNDHNHVNTRAELEAYDPGLAALCREVFGDTHIQYTKPTTRLIDHLSGYDPSLAPTFSWPDRLKQAKAAIALKNQERNKAENAQKR